MILQQQLSKLYQQACEIELQAFKPGNVSVYADGHDMTVADFRDSAKVSADALCNSDYSLGEKIYYAVQATKIEVACNTNLGIILLCAPLIQAMSKIEYGITLRQALHKVLIATTIEDAYCVFKAIMLASPGGLERADNQDVAEKPSLLFVNAFANADSAAEPRGPTIKSICAISLPSPTKDSPINTLLIFAMFIIP